MKFLCVECDEAMSMEGAQPPDASGSIRALFSCPTCGARTALLTNAHETEVVRSLGVKLRPVEEKTTGCPFGGMLQEMEAKSDGGGVHWTAEARARLDAIPEFVRPMAQQGIEHYARSEGHAEITVDILEHARTRFGM